MPTKYVSCSGTAWGRAGGEGGAQHPAAGCAPDPGDTPPAGHRGQPLPGLTGTALARSQRVRGTVPKQQGPRSDQPVPRGAVGALQGMGTAPAVPCTPWQEQKVFFLFSGKWHLLRGRRGCAAGAAPSCRGCRPHTPSMLRVAQPWPLLGFSGLSQPCQGCSGQADLGQRHFPRPQHPQMCRTGPCHPSPCPVGPMLQQEDS